MSGRNSATGTWRIWIDTGGTFTDCVARGPGGEARRIKVLSSGALRGRIERVIDPTTLVVRVRWEAPRDLIRGFRFRLLEPPSGPAAAGEDPVVESYSPTRRGADGDRDPGGTLRLANARDLELRAGAAFEVTSPEEAPVLAARMVTGTPAAHALPPIAMRLGTTLGTNALLQRRGSPVALFLTRGFGDLLRIGTQQRPDLFALSVRKPEPLYRRVVEVEERTAADGSVLAPLRLDPLVRSAARLLEEGVRDAAVALLNAHVNPDHERQLARVLKSEGFGHVSCSTDLAPFIGALARAETAVVNAYLSAIVGSYLDRVAAATSSGTLHVMTSAGGLVEARAFRPKDGLLSGPAGGVVGAALAGRRSRVEKLIAFDMGGTSTDVARFDRDFDYVFEHEVGGARLVAPALAIESVAAGGGSICALKAGQLRVGPESAGARPGPACYGAGGPLTLTDVNLLLGRLDPAGFEIPLSREAAEEAAERLAAAVSRDAGEQVHRDRLLEGLLDLANERMADAIRRVSLRRGYDPAEHALVAFGGAAGQHACAVAERLGMPMVVVPRQPGVLSAIGIGHARLERFAERQILEPLEEAEARLAGWMAELGSEATRRVAEECGDREDVEVRRRIVSLRFAGQEAPLQVEHDPDLPLREAFRMRYAEVFGHEPEARPVEIESVRVIASTRGEPDPETPVEDAPASEAPPSGREPAPACAASRVRAWFGGRWLDVPVYDRESLAPGSRLAGPALVFEAHSATAVEAGWDVELDRAGALLLRNSGARAARASATRRPEAVKLELFTNRFGAIAVEMGEMLRRTALSTNVKERLDFSCALLDHEGGLVVNAPHIPIHLGALGLCVRRVRDALPLEPGDVAVTNHPAFGGSHLPDVTVITPVHGRSGRLIGYAANRAHHAEIGGLRPGSMPPSARALAEEGVVIAPIYLVRGGVGQWPRVRELLRDAPHPSRAVEENLADLRSAVAANRRGAVALRALADEHGEDVVGRYMAALQERAERLLRGALERLPEGRHEALERLDDGSPLRVAIDLAGGRASIDFSGSAGVHAGNLNATPAIVRSVVTYVLRLLVHEPVPLNEGLLRAITLVIPPGILNPDFPDDPGRAPAVAGGNVETSQRLVDTLLKALRLVACSQGTMNNVLFGNETFGYYETVCGGCGAGPGFDGASAVHSHMTNTRITDPEVLERRYPARVERFAVREGSGGEGRFRGGDGAVRELTFLEPVSISIVSQHRVERPYGLDGGAPGAPGAQRLVRASGEVVELGPIDGCEADAGDRLVLETPGGGGFGSPLDATSQYVAGLR